MALLTCHFLFHIVIARSIVIPSFNCDLDCHSDCQSSCHSDQMSSSPDFLAGPLWSFFPILACVSFSEFCFGLVHVFFCLPLYFLILPILNGFLGLVAAVHAMFLRYPNKYILEFLISSENYFNSDVISICKSVQHSCLLYSSSSLQWKHFVYRCRIHQVKNRSNSNNSYDLQKNSWKRVCVMG